VAKTKRKRRTQAEMAKVRETAEKSGQLMEKIKNGEIDDKALLMESLPREIKTKIVYVKEPYQVIKEVRIINENQGTDKSVSEIVREEVGKVNAWEYKMIAMNQFGIKEMHKLGKEGWHYAFDLDPTITTAVKVTTFVFQRAR
jgi:hypothetical protein